MKLWLLLSFLLLPGPASRAAGNGSSGVGNKLPLDEGLEAQVAQADSFLMNKQGNRISDGRSGELLFTLDHVEKSHLPAGPGELVPARLGDVSGFEHLPSSAGSGTTSGAHYWLVCWDRKICLRLTPESKTNPKVDALIGALRASQP